MTCGEVKMSRVWVPVLKRWRTWRVGHTVNPGGQDSVLGVCSTARNKVLGAERQPGSGTAVKPWGVGLGYAHLGGN